jgi:cell division protein FtsW
VERVGTRPATWQRPDFPLLAAVAMLLVVGLDMVYSASYVIAHNDPSYGNDAYFLVQQLWRAGLGLAFLLVAQATDYHLWRRVGLPFVVLAVLLLIAVLATHLAHSAYGAQRWLKLGPLPAIEPSELVKLALVVYFADWLSRRQGRLTEFSSSTVPFAVTVGGICILVLLQPDLGTAIVIAATSVCLFFVAGADVRQLAVGLIGAAGALVLVVLGADYRSQRIAAFLDPSRDPLGAGFQVIQSTIAVGTGGVFGKGLMNGVQKLFYLPEPHTDFIYSVISEELGLVGATAVVICFAVITWRGLRVALRAPDTFGAFLALGLTAMMAVQAFFNISVALGLLPTKGIPLPFLSFGGSSLLINLLGMGILLNVSQQSSSTA